MLTSTQLDFHTLTQIDILKIKASTKCLICLEIFDQNAYIPQCGCSLCGSCMFEYLATQIRELNFTLDTTIIRCPNKSCGHTCSISEWRGDSCQPPTPLHYLPKNKEINDLLFLKYLQQQPDMRCCPISKCEYYGFLPDKQNLPCSDPFICERCDNTWVESLQSQVAFSFSSISYSILSWHIFLSKCTEFLSYCQKRLSSKRCPKCRIYIYKNRGCNHMNCRHCGYNFCWTCSLEYSHHSLAKCIINTTLKWSPFILIALTLLYLNGVHIKLWKLLNRLAHLTVLFCVQNFFIFLAYQSIQLGRDTVNLQSQLENQGYNPLIAKRQKQNYHLTIATVIILLVYLTVLLVGFNFAITELMAFAIIEAAVCLLCYYSYVFINFFYQNWIRYVY